MISVNNSVKIIGLTALFFTVIGCKTETKVTKGFYYWQSGYSSNENENQKLFQELGGERLYLKMFEVTYSDNEGAIPIGKTRIKLKNSYMNEAEIVPCVFIENDVLHKLAELKLDELADNIVFLVNKFMDENIFEQDAKNKMYRELQIDCDWSVSTKEAYFYLLKSIKEKANKEISCTMRLYPYKYRDEMGSPPVDRIMLLCYNLLNPKFNTDKNTILELDELKKYIDFKSNYPVPVDVALPVYSSGYRFEQQQFGGVFHAVPKEFEAFAIPMEMDLHYLIPNDTSLNYTYFHKGEKIKVERVSEAVLIEAARVLSNHFNQSEMNVALYHLDHEELNQYNYEVLDSIFTFFY
jgi:hypothetical protein